MKVKTPTGTFDTEIIKRIGFDDNAKVKLFLSSALQGTLPPQVLLDYMHEISKGGNKEKLDDVPRLSDNYFEIKHDIDLLKWVLKEDEQK